MKQNTNVDDKEIGIVEKKKGSNKFTLGVTVLLVIASASSFYFWSQYQGLKNNPQKVTEGEAKKIIDKIGQLTLLPKGEEPTVATITEPEKLKDQAFFIRAEKGDKLLIYNKAGKAYLFRPSIGKIIDATIFNPNQVQQVEASPEQTQEVNNN